MEFIKQAQERVLSHQEDQALLKAYIAEWRKFFTQCSYLPMPFGQLESALQGKTTTSIQKTKQNEESVVRKLMLDMWNQVRVLMIYLLQNFVLKLNIKLQVKRNNQLKIQTKNQFTTFLQFSNYIINYIFDNTITIAVPLVR